MEAELVSLDIYGMSPNNFVQKRTEATFLRRSLWAGQALIASGLLSDTEGKMEDSYISVLLFLFWFFRC